MGWTYSPSRSGDTDQSTPCMCASPLNYPCNSRPRVNRSRPYPPYMTTHTGQSNTRDQPTLCACAYTTRTTGQLPIKLHLHGFNMFHLAVRVQINQPRALSHSEVRGYRSNQPRARTDRRSSLDETPRSGQSRQQPCFLDKQGDGGNRP